MLGGHFKQIFNCFQKYEASLVLKSFYKISLQIIYIFDIYM